MSDDTTRVEDLEATIGDLQNRIAFLEVRRDSSQLGQVVPSTTVTVPDEELNDDLDDLPLSNSFGIDLIASPRTRKAITEVKRDYKLFMGNKEKSSPSVDMSDATLSPLSPESQLAESQLGSPLVNGSHDEDTFEDIQSKKMLNFDAAKSPFGGTQSDNQFPIQKTKSRIKNPKILRAQSTAVSPKMISNNKKKSKLLSPKPTPPKSTLTTTTTTHNTNKSRLSEPIYHDAKNKKTTATTASTGQQVERKLFDYIKTRNTKNNSSKPGGGSHTGGTTLTGPNGRPRSASAASTRATSPTGSKIPTTTTTSKIGGSSSRPRSVTADATTVNSSKSSKFLEQLGLILPPPTSETQVGPSSITPSNAANSKRKAVSQPVTPSSTATRPRSGLPVRRPNNNSKEEKDKRKSNGSSHETKTTTSTTTTTAPTSNIGPKTNGDHKTTTTTRLGSKSKDTTTKVSPAISENKSTTTTTTTSKPRRSSIGSDHGGGTGEDNTGAGGSDKKFRSMPVKPGVCIGKKLHSGFYLDTFARNACKRCQKKYVSHNFGTYCCQECGKDLLICDLCGRKLS